MGDRSEKADAEVAMTAATTKQHELGRVALLAIFPLWSQVTASLTDGCQL
jgi:hypothetical protein